MVTQQKSSYLTSLATIVTIAALAVAIGFYYPIINAYIKVGTSLSTTATNTCAQLRTELEFVIVLPSDAQYSALRTKSWSQAAWKNPTCIAIPTSSSDVQKVVRVLVANHVPFAIRSGGHSPNPLDANIDTGVLIATDKLDQVSYDAATGLASLGPGATWDAVYTALDKHDVTVVGGRVMKVGVGGLILGGGLSYLSDLYGLVCDNVISYEVKSQPSQKTTEDIGVAKRTNALGGTSRREHRRGYPRKSSRFILGTEGRC